MRDWRYGAGDGVRCAPARPRCYKTTNARYNTLIAGAETVDTGVGQAAVTGQPHHQLEAGSCRSLAWLSALSAPQSLLHLATMREKEGVEEPAGEVLP